MRNSNLLPVKANGEVRFLRWSPSGGRKNVGADIHEGFSFCLYTVPSSMDFRITHQLVADTTETWQGEPHWRPDGGLPALATEMRSRSWCFVNRLIMEARKRRNCAFSRGESTRLQKLRSRIGGDLQLLCFAASVDAGKRFLMEKTGETVLCGNLFMISMVSWF